MADFPTNIWIRDPVVEGRLARGGALNRAMALLSQARDEVTAIETKLGTDVAGTATDLKTRLAMRHSPSGNPRGRVFIGMPGMSNWYQHAGFNVQFGHSGPFTAAAQTITFPTAYTSAVTKPSVIIVKYGGNTTSNRCGDTQLFNDQITHTDFKVYSKEWSAAGTPVWGDAVSNYYVLWWAFGGS